MKLYVTGSKNNEALLSLCEELRSKGYTTTCPHDVVDDTLTEAQNLINRCQEVLRHEAVVTTNPLDGEWGPGAEREVKVAHAANIPVLPAITILKNTSPL